MPSSREPVYTDDFGGRQYPPDPHHNHRGPGYEYGSDSPPRGEKFTDLLKRKFREHTTESRPQRRQTYREPKRHYASSDSDSSPPPPPRRPRDHNSQPRPSRQRDNYESDYYDRPQRQRRPRDEDYYSDSRHNRPRRRDDDYDHPRPRRDPYDDARPRRDPYDDPRMRRGDGYDDPRYRSRYDDHPPRPRRHYDDDYYDRPPRDPRRGKSRDRGYDRYDRGGDRRMKKSKAEKEWQVQAKDMFMQYAVPVIKAEGGKFVSKQIGNYIAKKGK